MNESNKTNESGLVKIMNGVVEYTRRRPAIVYSIIFCLGMGLEITGQQIYNRIQDKLQEREEPSAEQTEMLNQIRQDLSGYVGY